MLNEKLSAADELRRPAEKNLLLPADGLHSAGSMHPHWRLGSLRRNGSYRRSARTGAGRLRFSDSALEESDLDITLIFNDHQFNINSMLEVVVTPDLGRLGLPARDEFLAQTRRNADCPWRPECRAPPRMPA